MPEVAVVALFCLTKPRKKPEVEQTRIQNWKGVVELFLDDLWLMSKFRDHYTMSISQ